MKEISSIIDSLYSHFLLRDIMAKVIPGLLLPIFIIFFILPIDPHDLPVGLKWLAPKSPLIPIILLYGLGLLFATLYQYLGRIIRLVRIFVWTDASSKRKFHLLRKKDLSVRKGVSFSFASVDVMDLRRKRERLIIFKEMTGNYAVAMFGIAVSYLIAQVIPPNRFEGVDGIRLIGLVIAIVALVATHYDLGEEQRLLEDFVIRAAVMQKDRRTFLFETSQE